MSNGLGNQKTTVPTPPSKASQPTPTPTGASPHDDPPTFATLKNWLVGRWVDIYSPPGHLLSVAYSDRADQDSSGQFSGKLLDVTTDAATGEVLFGIIQYAEKNARKYFQRDVIPLKGCAISVVLERDEQDDDEDDRGEIVKN